MPMIRKSALFIVLLSLVFAYAPEGKATEKSYFLEKNNGAKIDIVRIILDCKESFPDNKSLFKKCFAVTFLEARKELKAATKTAREHCASETDERSCIGEFIAEQLISADVIVSDGETPAKEKCPMATFRYADSECLFVTVPENRKNPRSKNIEIAVMIIKPHDYKESAAYDTPLFFLHGGPGLGILESNEFFTLQDWLINDRELILFDQRGVGYSKPSFHCFPEGLSNNLYHEIYQVKDALKACYKRWSEQYDLTAYTTQESAADVDAIRKALGYDKIDILGESYGTKLAVEVAHRFPDSVRSVIFDAVVGESGEPSHKYFQNAVDDFFERCKNTRECEREYPDLKSRFLDLLVRFSENPIVAEGKNPYTDEVREVRLTDDTVFRLLYNTLLDPDYHYFGQLLTLLENQKGGVNSWLSEWAEEGPSSKTSEVFGIAHYANRCMEDVPDWNQESIISDINTTLDEPLRKYFLNIYETYFEICALWGDVTPSASEGKKKANETPVLLLSGGVDFLTPPEEVGEIESDFPNSTHLIYPDASHGTAFSELCNEEIVLDFLEDPLAEVDASCIEDQIDRFDGRIRNL